MLFLPESTSGVVEGRGEGEGKGPRTPSTTTHTRWKTPNLPALQPTHTTHLAPLLPLPLALPLLP
jgi:hypothetical protein